MESPKTPRSSILKPSSTPRTVTPRASNRIATGGLTELEVDTPDSHNKTEGIRTPRVTFYHKDHIKIFSTDDESRITSSPRSSQIPSSGGDANAKQSDCDNDSLVSHVSNSDDEGETEGVNTPPGNCQVEQAEQPTPGTSRDIIRGRNQGMAPELSSTEWFGKNKSMAGTTNGGVKSSPDPLANTNGSRDLGLRHTVKNPLPPLRTATTLARMSSFIPISMGSKGNPNKIQRGRLESQTGCPGGTPSTSTGAKLGRPAKTGRTTKPSGLLESIRISNRATPKTKTSTNEAIPTTATPIQQPANQEPTMSAQGWGHISLVGRFLTPTIRLGTLGLGTALRRSISMDTMHRWDEFDKTKISSSPLPRVHSTFAINASPLVPPSNISRPFPENQQGRNEAMRIEPIEITIRSAEDEEQLEDLSNFDETSSYDERDGKEDGEMELNERSVVDLCSSGTSSPDFFESSIPLSDEVNRPTSLQGNIVFSFSDTPDEGELLEVSSEPTTSPVKLKNLEGTRGSDTNSSGNMTRNENSSQTVQIPPGQEIQPPSASRQRSQPQGQAPNPPPASKPRVPGNANEATSSSRTGRIPERPAPSATPPAPTMLYQEITGKLQNAPDRSDIYLYLEYKFSLVPQLCQLTDQEWKIIEKRFGHYFGPVYIETVNISRSNKRF